MKPALLAVAASSLLAFGWNAVSAQSRPESAKPAQKQQLYENWMFSCEQAACQVYLSLADEKTKEAKLSWAFLYDPKSNKISTVIQVPTRVALPPGVRVFLDEKTSFTWPFQFCDPSSCSAIAVVGDNEFASLSSREKAIVQFFQYGQQKPTSYAVPIAGLSAAAARLIADGKSGKQ
jgi:invasion protein IalB